MRRCSAPPAPAWRGRDRALRGIRRGSTCPIRSPPPEEARAAVDDYVKMKPAFIKIWVDDRRGTKKTLTPELYRAIADEAHKFNVPVGVHNVTLADAKELMRAGVEGWLHVPVRDGDVVGRRDRSASSRTASPSTTVRSCGSRLSLITAWMNTAGGTAAGLARRPAAAGDLCAGADREILGRPAQEDVAGAAGARAKEFRGRRPQRDEAARRRHARGRGHRHRPEPFPDRLFQSPRSRKHGGDRHDAHARRSSRRPATAPTSPTSTPAWWRRARAPTSSCSTPIRWRASPTRGGSTRSICAARKSPRAAMAAKWQAQFRQSASTR